MPTNKLTDESIVELEELGFDFHCPILSEEEEQMMTSAVTAYNEDTRREREKIVLHQHTELIMSMTLILK